MSTDVTNFESYPSSKTSLQALRDRTDHRIRIRIAELKQLYYGQELIPPSKMGTDIVCSVLILEKRNVEEEVPAAPAPSKGKAKKYRLSKTTADEAPKDVVEMIVTKRGSVFSNLGSSRYSTFQRQLKMYKRVSVESVQNSRLGSMMSVTVSPSKISTSKQDSVVNFASGSMARKSSMAIGRRISTGQGRRPSMMSRENSIAIGPKGTNSSLTLGVDSRLVTNRRQSTVQTAINNNAPAKPHRQSLVQMLTGTKPSTDQSDLKVVAQVDIHFTNGVCNEEFEFELNEDFYGVEFQVVRKGKNTLATYFLPYLSLEPDEESHEEWVTLHCDNVSSEGGYAFMSEELESARPCYLCKTVLSPDVSSDISIVKCMQCGVVCDEGCMNSIAATCKRLPSARITYVYTREKILDPPICRHMYELINAVDRTFIWTFAKACADFEDAAFHFIRISQVITKREQVDLLASICEEELKSASSIGTIFRLNSLATKMMDTYLKQEAAEYLLSTLENPISEILKEDRDCEIDPSKIDNCDPALLDSRHGLLERYTEMLLRAITSNLRNCPFALRCVMKRIYEKSKAIFHDEPSAGYIAVSSFLFLRFFVPALQNPTLVDIFIDTVSIRPKRTFTLLSKILQKISNLCEFGVEKEGYMTPLNRFVPDYHPIITTYIAEICRVRTETSPTTNLQHQELVSRSLFSVKIKPTFSEKYLMCCFRPPQDDLSESMDMFRQPGTFDVDSESSNDMDSPVDELSLAVIDTELHLSALIRHINICKDRMMMLVDPNNAHQVYPHLVKLLSFDKKDKKHSTSEELSYKHIRKLLLKNSTFSDTPRLQTASNPLGIEITLTSPTVPFVDTTTKFIDRGETVTSDSPLSAFLPRLGKGTSPAPTFLSPVLPFETIMESSCSGSFDGGLAASIRDNEATCNAPLEGKSSSPIISRSDDQAFHHDTPASIESLTADALVENVDSHSPESLKPGYTESEEDVKEQYLQSFNHTSKSESLRSIQGSSELVEQPPMIPDAILAMDEPMDLPNDDEETSPESDIFFSTVEHANEGALLTGIEDHGKPISQSNSVMDEDEADAYVIQKRPSVASSSKTPSQTSSASIGEDKRGSMKHRRSITSIKDAARRRSSAFAFKGGLANAMYRKQSVVTGSDESVHEDPIFDFLHTVGKKGKVTAQYAAPGPSGNNRRKSSHQLSESGSFIVRKNR